MSGGTIPGSRWLRVESKPGPAGDARDRGDCNSRKSGRCEKRNRRHALLPGRCVALAAVGGTNGTFTRVAGSALMLHDAGARGLILASLYRAVDVSGQHEL